MYFSRSLIGALLALMILSHGEAEAQRRGSVRYSGGAQSRATSSYHSSSSAPVRYQKPMNMPAPGARAATLPAGYRRSYYGGSSYYYSGGSYYYDTAETDSSEGIPGYHTSTRTGQSTTKSKPVSAAASGERYEVVTPPVGVVVDELPVGTVEVKKGLYQYNDVYYRPAYEDGVIKYVVSLP